jgi:hypothetical protein
VILILTTGGSGSLYIQKCFEARGVKLGHMRMGPDGMVGPQLMTDTKWGNEYTWADWRDKFERIYCQVRHPLKVIASARWLRRGYVSQVAEQLEIDTWNVNARAKYWLTYNLSGMWRAHKTYRIEDINEVWGEIGIGGLPDIPKDTHHRARPPPRPAGVHLAGYIGCLLAARCSGCSGRTGV